jgi:small-conductance mechanosensitive channel
MTSILRGALKWLALVLITVAFWVANLTYPHPYLNNLVFTFFSISVIYLLLRVLFEHITLSRIQDIKTKYAFRKGTTVLFYLLIAVTVAMVWVQNTQALLLSYGIIGAGIAIALQDVFKNFAGSIFIITSGLYTVGDRIEINKMYGDVIDIGLWNTTLMEIREWVIGDQPTGRITLIPNGLVIGNPVLNYTKDFTFIWDEITIPITYGSDWKKAATVFMGILREQHDVISSVAEKAIELVGEKYYILPKVVEPAIYLTLTDNWVQFSLRYVVDVRERRAVQDHLNRKILEAVEREDRITIASETMTVTGSHKVELKRGEGEQVQ